MDESVESLRGLLTLDELTNRVGMSVRNVRFYTTKGLVPPPIRRGRSGYYSADHVARLELVQELQGHGFTLSAIEKYVAGIPGDATPEDIALHRTMLAPWQADLPVEMSRAELVKRTGRDLTDDDLTTLAALGIVFRTKRGRYEVAVSQLSVGLGLLDLGFPIEAAIAAADVYAEHGRQIAKELNDALPHHGVAGLQGVRRLARQAARGRGAAQAAVDRQPGVGLRGRDGRDPARGHRAPYPLICFGTSPDGYDTAVNRTHRPRHRRHRIHRQPARARPHRTRVRREGDDPASRDLRRSGRSGRR